MTQTNLSNKELEALLLFLTGNITPATCVCRMLQSCGLMDKEQRSRRFGVRRWMITLQGITAARSYEQFSRKMTA